MFKPWVSIPVDSAMVSVDYDYGDIRIMFNDVKTVDDVIAQLENVREVIAEMEKSK